jgi:hypothetical protein
VNIGSFINSALTPRGTNARRAQEKEQASVSAGAAGLFKGGLPMIQSQQAFAGGLEPQRQEAITSLIRSLSPGSQRAGLERQKRAAQQRAFGSMRMMRPGMGAGMQAGARLAAQNQSAMASNDLERMYASPEYQTAIQQTLMQAILGGQQISGLGDLSGLAGLIYGRPGVQVQPGFLESLAPAIGAYVGGLK